MYGSGQNITKLPVFHQILDPALCYKHPHGICTLVKHVHSASRADWKWFILGAVYYRR